MDLEVYIRVMAPARSCFYDPGYQ